MSWDSRGVQEEFAKTFLFGLTLVNSNAYKFIIELTEKKAM